MYGRTANCKESYKGISSRSRKSTQDYPRPGANLVWQVSLTLENASPPRPSPNWGFTASLKRSGCSEAAVSHLDPSIPFFFPAQPLCECAFFFFKLCRGSSLFCVDPTPGAALPPKVPVLGWLVKVMVRLSRWDPGARESWAVPRKATQEVPGLDHRGRSPFGRFL